QHLLERRLPTRLVLIRGVAGAGVADVDHAIGHRRVLGTLVRGARGARGRRVELLTPNGIVRIGPFLPVLIVGGDRLPLGARDQGGEAALVDPLAGRRHAEDQRAVVGARHPPLAAAAARRAAVAVVAAAAIVAARARGAPAPVVAAAAASAPAAS